MKQEPSGVNLKESPGFSRGEKVNEYRFPDSLGGGIHEEYRHVSGDTEAPIGTVAFLINNALICVARTLLTKVQQLEEPLDGSAVLDRDRDAWQRTPGGRWTSTVSSKLLESPFSWDLLGRHFGPLTLLAPALEQVELPWEAAWGPFSGSSVCLDGKLGLICDINRAPSCFTEVTLTPEQAEAKAAALWTAASLARELNVVDSDDEEPWA